MMATEFAPPDSELLATWIGTRTMPSKEMFAVTSIRTLTLLAPERGETPSLEIWEEEEDSDIE